MNRRVLGVALSAALIASLFVLPTTPVKAAANGADFGNTIKAGYGVADATWHVGAGAGQYSDKSPDSVQGLGDQSEIDPHNHSTTQKNSYGVHSRLSYRTIVVEDVEGDQVAFVKSDSYLAMDYLARRVGQLLDAAESSVSYDEIFHMASHNHSSPYYMTPSWGVWLFQDAFDLRAFEYHARAMAQSILAAEADLQPARMGATKIEHKLFKGVIARRTTADDGTPAGYPLDFGDFGLDVVRFDALEGAPIATLINWGQHPEGLDGHDLITGDFVAPLERFVERATGAPLVFGQGDVGSAEAGPGHPELIPEGIPRRWSHAGHAQGERGAFLLAQDVIKGWSEAATPSALVPMDSDFDVAAGNAWMPGPLSHPYPSVSNCRSEPTVEGNPGSPIIGLPDCARAQDSDDRTLMIWELLKAEGIPVPAHYDAPAFTGVEENLRIHLQAFKLGEVILLSCACEAQVDLILNLESRTDDIVGNMWDGYDWTERLDCTQASPPDGDWTCAPKPGDNGRIAFGSDLTFSDASYDRMVAQVHNDAAGWDLPENAVAANAEPKDAEQIWGNFTHDELSAEEGYALPIGVGHAGDYNGYTVSYREYMSYDHYRKALTSYGPHTADYMNTTLQELARELNDGDDDDTFDFRAYDEPRYLADEARQEAGATVLGQTAGTTYDAWRASIPDDVGPAEALTQPEDIARFNAATFSWRGGDNAVDNPTVVVQRRQDDTWEPFADASGEVQTKLQFPEGVNGFFDTYAGNQEWVWTANFEAFNAFPEGIGSTPEGTYRFVVEGAIRQNGTDRHYEITSEEFTVSPWDGLKVQDIRAEDDGSVSFTVDSTYPQTYDSVFDYVGVQMENEAGEDAINDPFCETCSFRPWATSGGPVTAELTVVSPVGRHSKVPATCEFQESTNISTCSSTLPAEGQSFIASGDVVDSYGETNAQCYELDADGGDTCPAAESDVDEDGFLDGEDNCRDVANPGQSNRDGDGLGDACDDDLDGDSALNDSDNCPEQANADQADGDGDDIGDACDEDLEDGPQGDSDTDGVPNEEDNCPEDANTNQGNIDGDAEGDACDADGSDGPLADPDADGRTNAEEAAAGTDPQDACDPDNTGQSCDADDDGVVNATDNCDAAPNPDQNDADGDGIGDVCDDSPSPAPTTNETSPPPGGGSGGGGTGGGGSGPSTTPSTSPSTQPSAAPTQTAAGDERGTVRSSIAANKLRTRYRKPVTLSGQVDGDRTCAATEIEILARTFGSTQLRSIEIASVGADGSWTARVRSARSTAYAARPVDNELCDGEVSSALDVRVKARVTATVRNRCNVRRTVRGRVAPAYPGTFVKLQDKRKGRWVTVGRAKLNKKSRFRFARCRGDRVVWPKQDLRNQKGRAPILTRVSIS